MKTYKRLAALLAILGCLYLSTCKNLSNETEQLVVPEKESIIKKDSVEKKTSPPLKENEPTKSKIKGIDSLKPISATP